MMVAAKNPRRLLTPVQGDRRETAERTEYEQAWLFGRRDA